MTHVFATYAFVSGIQSGDIPLGAAISLFMVPILGIAAFFVLIGVLYFRPNGLFGSYAT